MDLVIARGDVSNLTLVWSVTILQLICTSTSSQQPSSCVHLLPLPHHNTSPAPSPAETCHVAPPSVVLTQCSCSCQVPPDAPCPHLALLLSSDCRAAVCGQQDLREILNILKTVSGHTTIPSPKIIREGNWDIDMNHEILSHKNALRCLKYEFLD